MTPTEWIVAHKVRRAEGMAQVCSDCLDEDPFWEVDGTRDRIGLRCVEEAVADATDELLARLWWD